MVIALHQETIGDILVSLVLWNHQDVRLILVHGY
jgi:hypothetical protein